MLTSKCGTQILVSGLLLAWACFCSPTVNWAQEFRIESEVYVGDEKTPVSQNLTLFSDGMIYDFQMSGDAQPKPLEIAIYDKRDKYFVLVDLVRNQRLKLEQVQIIQMVEGLRQQTSQNELTKFLVADKFEENFDLATGLTELISPSIEYRFFGKQPSDVAILPAYFEFLDQFTRLNASDPTKLPPFPRLQLNRSIQKLGWFPTKVEMKLHKNELFKSDISLSSKHTLIMNLSEKDRQRIKDAKSAWMKTAQVDLRTYRNLKSSRGLSIPRPEKTETKASKPPVIDD